MEKMNTKVMVGDWVLRKGDGPGDAVPVQVTPSMLCEGPDFWDKHYGYLELTEDILRKNGFHGDGYLFLDIDENIHFEYYPHEKRLTRWYRGVDEWENHSEVKDITFRCTCRYVHEFQQALRLCKVQTEIVV